MQNSKIVQKALICIILLFTVSCHKSHSDNKYKQDRLSYGVVAVLGCMAEKKLLPKSFRFNIDVRSSDEVFVNVLIGNKSYCEGRLGYWRGLYYSAQLSEPKFEIDGRFSDDMQRYLSVGLNFAASRGVNLLEGGEISIERTPENSVFFDYNSAVRYVGNHCSVVIIEEDGLMYFEPGA